MKISKLLTYVVPAAAAMFSVVGCTDFDNGFDSKNAQYQKQFEMQFGDIDPNQDWNVATRANVTVTTAGESDIKIYAYNGSKYQIVGDYSDVNGTQELGVDVKEGTTELLVTDGRTSIRTKVGGTASFLSTRAVHETTDPEEFVKVSKVPTEGITIDNKFYSQYLTIEESDYTDLKTFLPEINMNDNYRKHTNLPQVTHDFTYISTGKFVIYPYYWVTNGNDKLGVYYYSGSTKVEVGVYDIKGDELQYKQVDQPSVLVNLPIDDPRCARDYDWSDEIAAGQVEGTDYKKAVWVYDSNMDKWDMQYAAQTLSETTYKWNSFGGTDCNDIFTTGFNGLQVRGQGIVVDIPEGTVFGMYLINGPCEFYSQSSLNKEQGYAVIDDGSGTLETSATEYASYASTFELNGQMFLGFEDWTNKNNASDMDLNDVVFAFSGATPTVIDEDPTSASWILACEDLGGTLDIDYNDIVFSVEHVSGRTTATVTPLAAGGTLESHLYFGSQDLGEIHQLLGAAEAATGSYTPINVGESRGNAGTQKTIVVDKDFSMASSEVGSITSSGNMGGFSIRTSYDDGTSSPSVIAAPELGKAPAMICLPYTYEVENDPEVGKKTTYTWAWSQEMKAFYDLSGKGTYGAGSYPEFAGWVKDHTVNTDWYKHPAAGLSVSAKKTVSDMSSSGGDPTPSEPTSKGTLITELSGVTTATVWGCQGYFVPSSLLTDATSITVTYEGVHTSFMANAAGSSSFNDSFTGEVQTVPADKLAACVSEGFYICFNSGFADTSVYLKIEK